MSTLYLDFETRSAVDLKTQGADVYARDPSTDILCVGWAIDDEPVRLFSGENAETEMYDLMNPLMEMVPVVAHNAAFELAIWNHVCVPKYKWPPLHPEQMVCTMAMAYAQSLPGGLADAAPAAGLTMQKDSIGHRIMMKLSQPRSVDEKTGAVKWWAPQDVPKDFQKLYAYCKQDVEVERALYKRLVKLSPSEQSLWILDHQINQRGIQIDISAVRKAIEIVEMEKKRLDAEMRGVTKGAVATCTATGQLTDWLKWKLGESIEVDGVAKSDVLEMLENPTLPSDCRRALLLRQEAAKSSTAKLKAMISRTCDDGRVRSTMQFHGAGTGRWAGRGLQTQNFPRPTISQEDIENVFEILEGANI